MLRRAGDLPPSAGVRQPPCGRGKGVAAAQDGARATAAQRRRRPQETLSRTSAVRTLPRRHQGRRRLAVDWQAAPPRRGAELVLSRAQSSAGGDDSTWRRAGTTRASACIARTRRAAASVTQQRMREEERRVMGEPRLRKWWRPDCRGTSARQLYRHYCAAPALRARVERSRQRRASLYRAGPAMQGLRRCAGRALRGALSAALSAPPAAEARSAVRMLHKPRCRNLRSRAASLTLPPRAPVPNRRAQPQPPPLLPLAGRSTLAARRVVCWRARCAAR